MTQQERAQKTDLFFQKNRILEQERQINSRKAEIIKGLPHLYGRPWYAWAKAFFNSQNKMNLITAANQISKSSTLIRKAIHRSTNQKLWPILWPHIWPEQENLQPSFWYFYPSQDVGTFEFDEKWVKEFLPRGTYRTDPYFGWEEDKEKGNIKALHFKNGSTINFKFYTQNLTNLQTATIHGIYGDEEMPEHMYPELQFRLAATNGYWDGVFTATRGEMLWYRAMECIGLDTEAFRDAFKQTVSMFDCLVYEDGSPSPWTEKRIQEIINSCSSPAEVQRRVYGRFVKEVGRKYGAFSADRHVVKPFNIPGNYSIYAAVDPGSGGDTGHPAAIAFLAVAPDHKRGYIFRGWRGDGVLTTSGDVLDKFRELRGNLKCVKQSYDHAAKDFGTIASRQSESFVKAEKSHELGEDIINTLFKNDMLFIFDLPELTPLVTEISMLNRDTPKTKAKDDYCDAARYACVGVPWDFTALKGFVQEAERPEEVSKPLSEQEYLALEIEQRRGTVKKKISETWEEFDEDISFWNEEYGS